MERFTCCSYDSLHIAKFHSRKAIALATAFAIASFDVVIMLCLCSADNGMNEESALVFRNTAKTKKISWLPGSVQSNTSNLVLHQCHDYCGFATAVQEQCNVQTEGQNICPNKLLLCLPFQCHVRHFGLAMPSDGSTRDLPWLLVKAFGLLSGQQPQITTKGGSR